MHQKLSLPDSCSDQKQAAHDKDNSKQHQSDTSKPQKEHKQYGGIYDQFERALNSWRSAKLGSSDEFSPVLGKRFTPEPSGNPFNQDYPRLSF